jgi:hypothetical protein
VPKEADGFFSKDDELIDFNKNIHVNPTNNFICEGRVEDWLKKLEDKMRETLYLVLCEAKNSS